MALEFTEPLHHNSGNAWLLRNLHYDLKGLLAFVGTELQ